MKTIKRILFLVAVALGLASCGSNHVDVAEEFITNFNTGNYDKAKEYCTEGAKSLVDLAVSFKHKPVEDWKTEIVKDSVFSDRFTFCHCAFCVRRAAGNATNSALYVRRFCEC